MRQEFRDALTSWRGKDTIDEREEYPNEDEGCGVMTSQQPITSNNSNFTDSLSQQPQMVTTNIQHRGGDINADIGIKDDQKHNLTFKTSRLSSSSNNYGPLAQEKIKARPFKAAKKVS